MKLYHGSPYRNINHFDFRHNRRGDLDFGKGVYFTSNFEQAKEWSCNKKKTGAVYECDIDLSSFKIIHYNSRENEDLLYILYLCRIGLEDIAVETINGFDKADIIAGLMLDGRTVDFRIIAEKFNEGDISFDEFSKQTKLYENVFDQFCIKTQRVLDMVNVSISNVYYTKKEQGIIEIEQEICKAI